MSNIYQEALEAHKRWQGKLSVTAKAPVSNKEELSLAYSPGVAEPCREIQKDKEKMYDYTWKGNSVAVVTDGSAVLGLGNIGPEAALPVMEGKAVLFNQFGGINLEDISAPRCVEIERRLIEALDIPVFHDDQHGTAIVTVAALINALKLTGKKKEDIKVVVSGAGAAGSSIVKLLRDFGVTRIYVFNSRGILSQAKSAGYNFLQKEIAALSNPDNLDTDMAGAMVGADVFIGVSLGGLVTQEMVRSMNDLPIIFAMANPEPEIGYHEALEAGAAVVGTGRSDFPNQINNVLAFPGIFKGALSARAKKITDEMKLAAAEGIASIVSDEELAFDYVIPSAFNEKVAAVVADAVAKRVR
ncbi:NAD(P)-dependent malic enzyme [Vagococcus acidifermentans]|uniref:NAD-dependent malic enzyme n=1 Tax=Vagococcus acidifermentans TaxID=564710 RepID=A0A430B0Q4_9ENTE|nr:malic enzyme-like NAD(P)-binding protein [Vagococcus acidifermentans]RSU13923.1 NAD-dependent malic enzyme [Vagococcus acidifermentans]